MKFENYKALCRSCDDLLTDQNSTRARVAIPWLHIVREHPHFLEQYEYLFNQKGGAVWLSNILLLFRNLSGWLRQVLRSVRCADDLLPPRLAQAPRSVDLLIVSHLINAGHLAAEKDFYFGKLPGFLKAQGRNIVVALINHTNHKFDEENRVSCLEDGVHRIVLDDRMCFSKTWSCFSAALSESIALLKKGVDMSEPLGRRVCRRAALEMLSGGARDAQRVAQQISDLVRTLGCRAVLTTYEGHAWERAVYGQVRLASPSVRCFAYQHAAVFHLQHGLKRALGPTYDPDVVFASGEFPAAEMAGVGGNGAPQVRVLGSTRAVSIDKAQLIIQRNLDGKECLVLPEGLKTECTLMISFAIACAKQLSNIRFVLRLHPAIQLSSLKADVPELAALPVNVVFSTRSLEGDAQRASWVLYRGTTAVVAGAQYGAQPIYLQAENEEMSIDPLYSLGDERPIVRDVSEFSECVLGRGASEEGVFVQRKKINDHFQALYSPLNCQVIAECL